MRALVLAFCPRMCIHWDGVERSYSAVIEILLYAHMRKVRGLIVIAMASLCFLSSFFGLQEQVDKASSRVRERCTAITP